jgi:hypothetical protein
MRMERNFESDFPAVDLIGRRELLIRRGVLDTLSIQTCRSKKQTAQSGKLKVNHGPYRLLRYYEIE